MMSMSVEPKIESEVIPRSVESEARLVSLDERVKNVEQIAATIEKVADNALNSWTQYLKFKAEHAERELNTSDAQHKRASFILMVTIAMVFVLLVMSIYKEQYDLVKIILGSALAVAAGAGINNVFHKKTDK